MISLNFDDLFEQALKDWSKIINVDKPVKERGFMWDDDVSKKYYRTKASIIFSNLHGVIYDCLRSGLSLRMMKQRIKEDFAYSLQEHISRFDPDAQLTSSDWDAEDIALAKAYLDANPTEEEKLPQQ